MTTNNEFETKDQWLASLLYASGQELVKNEWRFGECWFCFRNKTKCEKTVSDFYAGKILLDARIIINGIKTIKGILHSKN